MEILESAISFYKMRKHATDESLNVLNVISDSVLQVYFQNNPVFTSEYLVRKESFIIFLKGLEKSFSEMENETPDTIEEEKILLVQLKQFRNAIREVSQHLLLKNFSGDLNFDKLIDSLTNITLFKALKPIDPSPIFKYFILEAIEDIKVMVLKTELQMIVSVLLNEDKINGQFVDFINTIFEELEDKYHALKAEDLERENENEWNEIKSKESNNTYFNELFSYTENLKKTILDDKLFETQKQELASQFTYFIANIPTHLNHYTKIPALFFLPKSQEEFLMEFENKNNREQVRSKNRIISGCLNILKSLD